MIYLQLWGPTPSFQHSNHFKTLADYMHSHGGSKCDRWMSAINREEIRMIVSQNGTQFYVSFIDVLLQSYTESHGLGGLKFHDQC